MDGLDNTSLAFHWQFLEQLFQTLENLTFGLIVGNEYQYCHINTENILELVHKQIRGTSTHTVCMQEVVQTVKKAHFVLMNAGTKKLVFKSRPSSIEHGKAFFFIHYKVFSQQNFLSKSVVCELAAYTMFYRLKSRTMALI